MSDSYFIYDDLGQSFEVSEKDNEDLHLGWRPTGWNDPIAVIQKINANPYTSEAEELAWGLHKNKQCIVWSGDLGCKGDVWHNAQLPQNFMSYEQLQGDWAEDMYGNRKPNRRTRRQMKKNQRIMRDKRRAYWRNRKIEHAHIRALNDDEIPF